MRLPCFVSRETMEMYRTEKNFVNVFNANHSNGTLTISSLNSSFPERVYTTAKYEFHMIVLMQILYPAFRFEIKAKQPFVSILKKLNDRIKQLLLIHVMDRVVISSFF